MRELPDGETDSGTEALQAVGVVGLVVGHGHDELRDAGGESLGHRSDAAVMHENRRVTQQRAEWRVFGDEDG